MRNELPVAGYQLPGKDGQRDNGQRTTDEGQILRLLQAQSAQIAALKDSLFDEQEKRTREQERRPLMEHLTEYRDVLAARGSTAKHVIQVVRQTRAVIRLARARHWVDLSRSSVERAMGRLTAERGNKLPVASCQLPVRRKKLRQRARKTLGPATANHYLSSIKAFCKWMIDDFRARCGRHPCRAVKPLHVESDLRHPRRALTRAEFLRLLDAANNGAAIAGIPGYERAMGYLLAATSGLRSGELQSLTSIGFDLGEQPRVTLDGAYTKNGHKAIIPIRADVAAMIRTYLTQVGREKQIFRRPSGNEMRGLRKDLKAAGIPYRTAEGFADFHALRHTFVTNLFEHGATPREAMDLARHRTPGLTLKRYAHSTEAARRNVVERFPAPPELGRKADCEAPPARSPAAGVLESEHQWSHRESNSDLLNAIQPSEGKPHDPQKLSSSSATSGTSTLSEIDRLKQELAEAQRQIAALRAGKTAEGSAK